jgi:hypothetical protein
MPFLDPGTTVIEYRGRTIYKANRFFQESVPFATNIKVSEKQIDWEDGELKYHLNLENADNINPDSATNTPLTNSIPKSTSETASSSR